jgi:tetratricopeptide (TPR) repeat protein
MVPTVDRPLRDRGYRLAFWLALLCVFGQMTSGAAVAKEKWINLQTKNFNIVSNADEGATRGLALKLEQFQYIISKLFDIKRPSPVPITVVVFKDDGSFKPFKPLYNGKPANLAGYFQRDENESVIALNINGNEQHPLYVIFHEYMHIITSFGKRQWPLWLNEGVAELYSTFEVNQNKVDLGRPVERHVRLLRENKFIPLQALFSVDNKSPAYNEREKQGIFYAESWALVHYLMFGDKSAHQHQFIEFIKMFEAGESVDKAFAAVFGSDFTVIEKALHHYISGDYYAFATATLDNTVGEAGVEIQALSEADVQFYLGSLLLHVNRPEEAINFFKQAAVLDPASPHSYEGLGFVAMRHGDFSHAAEEFKQAVEHGSRNYLADYEYAEALFRQQSLGGAAIDADTKRTISEELKKSINLVPGFAQSYYLLGNLSLATGENIEQGIQWAKTAVRLDPQRKYFALTLAQLQIRTKAYDDARATLAPLLAADTDQQLRAAADSVSHEIDVRIRRGSPPASAADSQGVAGVVLDSGHPRILHRERVEDPDAPPPMPELKIPGTDSMTGVLTAIECTGGKSVVLVLKTEADTKRFSVPDLTMLHFLASTPSTESIGCGPMNRPVIVHFKPASSGQTKYAGQAVTVELKQ